MDPQLKRGFLEVCVLTALRQQDSYGYQVIKDVPECLSLTESTLYPLLKRLEASECVTEYSVEHNGRLRKYYQILPKGVERIDEFVEESEGIEEVLEYVKRGAGK